MVVVSGSWVKNVATYPTPASNCEMLIPPSVKMSAKAILICRPNSHPFQDRTVTLDQPVKVGRSVARARATATNAIFDCKVLSRHHALLWYDAGKFYLQDTKSSNGTFVNNNRLSSTDSEPHEVCSGDIVQFGVDVVENNRKVTHCCIVATLKLYLADGKEAKASPSIVETTRHGLVPLDELYKLNQVIQEARQREQCLENKLSALQTIIEETRRSTDESWQAYIGEERLLSRVSTLENQLAQANKNVTDDRLREELGKLEEEKSSYQIAAKEALRKLHEERLEAVGLVTEQERARISAEQEAVLAKEQLIQAQAELQDIAQKLMKEQEKADEEKTQLEQRERELQARLDSETKVVNDLQTKVKQYKSIISNPLEELEKCSLIYDDLNIKQEYLENQNTYDDSSKKPFDLKTLVGDEDDGGDTDGESDITCNEDQVDTEEELHKNISVSFAEEQSVICSKDDDEEEENEKERNCNSDCTKDKSNVQNGDESHGDTVIEKKVDSKTLKYQFQSVQTELKKQIEQLEKQSLANKLKMYELEASLTEEKLNSHEKSEECSQLKEELGALRLKWEDSCNDLSQMQQTVLHMSRRLENSSLSRETLESSNESKQEESNSLSISATNLMAEQISALEEELVLLKERYAAISNEKLSLNKNLIAVQDQYKAVCNRSYNAMFFYVAPLVLMVLYLLISQYFS